MRRGCCKLQLIGSNQRVLVRRQPRRQRELRGKAGRRAAAEEALEDVVPRDGTKGVVAMEAEGKDAGG